jgi:ParB family chromosome partitioning protein
MTKRRRGLGSIGVDVLLSAATSPLADMNTPKEVMKTVPVDVIQRGKYQPRGTIPPETLEELANSIRSQGLVQPIVVRPVEGGYELIAGERRWRAAQLAGLTEIPAVIKPVPDQAAAAMTLIENIQRENLNPFEEASALQRLIDEFQLTHQQLADAIGRSRAAVSNLLRLLELGEPARQYLIQGVLEMGHARALLALPHPLQSDAAHYVVNKSLSVRETERYVKRLLSAQPEPDAVSEPADVAQLEQQLSNTLGTKVTVRQNGHGRGRVVIQYATLDQLNVVLSHIK